MSTISPYFISLFSISHFNLHAYVIITKKLTLIISSYYTFNPDVGVMLEGLVTKYKNYPYQNDAWNKVQ